MFGIYQALCGGQTDSNPMDPMGMSMGKGFASLAKGGMLAA